MIVIPFEIEHLDSLQLQEKQLLSHEAIQSPEYRAILRQYSTAWSMINPNTMETICCAGFINAGYGRCTTWALLGVRAKHYLLAITRQINQKTKGFKRVELLASFPESRRWAEMMGFRCETPDGMLHYCNDETFYLYSRISNDERIT